MNSLALFFGGAFAGGGLTLAVMFMAACLTESGDDHDEDI